MKLQLVYHGLYFGVLKDHFQMMGQAVADADCPDAPCFIQLLHGAPGIL